jgi:hypothetical protein
MVRRRVGESPRSFPLGKLGESGFLGELVLEAKRGEWDCNCLTTQQFGVFGV